MNQNPRKYVVAMMRGPLKVGMNGNHFFRLVLEWEPTPKPTKLYANMSNEYCTEGCEDVAREQADELAAFLNAMMKIKPNMCNVCYVEFDRAREDELKKRRK